LRGDYIEVGFKAFDESSLNGFSISRGIDGQG